MPRRINSPVKVVFSTRLEPELVQLLRQWADAERRSVSDQIAILIDQEAARRRQATLVNRDHGHDLK